MGEEDKAAERIALLRPYQVNKRNVRDDRKDTTVVMHCLPAVKGHEITEDVSTLCRCDFDEAGKSYVHDQSCYGSDFRILGDRIFNEK